MSPAILFLVLLRMGNGLTRVSVAASQRSTKQPHRVDRTTEDLKQQSYIGVFTSMLCAARCAIIRDVLPSTRSMLMLSTRGDPYESVCGPSPACSAVSSASRMRDRPEVAGIPDGSGTGNFRVC